MGDDDYTVIERKWVAEISAPHITSPRHFMKATAVVWLTEGYQPEGVEWTQTDSIRVVSGVAP